MGAGKLDKYAHALIHEIICISSFAKKKKKKTVHVFVSHR
jgi:hypothetical protein